MIEYAHHVTETIVNTFSTGFNVLLLYLIVFHSSFGTPTYQVMLTIDALLDLSLSVVVFLLQPCMLVAFFVLILLNIMWVVIQFVYRYVFLCLKPNQ
ncbi:hypothetical protein AAVH_24250 [Aphelenchoides avenae]|nr:hypothetical protein AAVH_24250 [Aphelenchus avenae]